MLARRSAIETAIDTDFGHRSRHETAMMEIVGVVQGIDYLARNLRRFMRPTRRHIALDMRFGSNRVEYQPLGVVGIISLWNYPVNLSLMPVVTAIAGGNRVMLKPSKLTPATNAVLASMFSELFPEEQVARISRFHERYPDIDLQFNMNFGRIDVVRDKIAVAIRNSMIEAPLDVVVRELAVEHVGLVCSPDYMRAARLRSFDDLAAARRLAPRTRPKAWEEWATAFRYEGLELPVHDYYDHFLLDDPGGDLRPRYRPGAAHAGPR